MNLELERWLGNGLQHSCDILIVNDSSESNIIKESNLILAGDSLRVIENGKNLGYAKSFMTLLQNINTNYGLVLADDDELDLDNIKLLIAFLGTSNSPLIRTQWRGIDGSHVYPENKKAIILREIPHYFNHAPGIVYRRDIINNYLHFLDDQIEITNNLWVKFYPQVVLSYLVNANSELLYIPLSTGGYSQIGPQETDLKDSEGRDYSDSYVQFKVRLDMIRTLRLMKSDPYLSLIRYKLFIHTFVIWLKSFGLAKANYLNNRNIESNYHKLSIFYYDARSLFVALFGRP